MSNQVKLVVEFSFKGETHSPSIEVDLDQLMARDGRLPDFYPLIARQNSIDSYSYEYEMMLAEEIQCIARQGMAFDCIDNGLLDTEVFEKCWRESRKLTILQAIASKHLAIENL
ncbi:MAG: hypothetical protein GXP10_04450, partial [Gammaproteobacteria bacterium]|nr:hypothetical protein [Gammaproteobacteria bacterium]